MDVWPFRYILLFDKTYYADNNAFFRPTTNVTNNVTTTNKDSVIKPPCKIYFA